MFEGVLGHVEVGVYVCVERFDPLVSVYGISSLTFNLEKVRKGRNTRRVHGCH